MKVLHQGRRAVVTISETVGSLLCMYLPLVIVCVYEGAARDTVDDSVFKLALVAIMAAPVINGVAFGFKHKVIYMGVLHFFRKEMYKSEVQQEIRLRSPGGPGAGQPGSGAPGGGGGLGSNRPSMGSIVGHITLHMPTYLTRQLSYTSLAPVSNLIIK